MAKGFTQVGGSDFDHTFSSMISDITFRIMLIVKILWGLDSCLFDVETAFLLGEFEDGIEIYMRLPEEVEGDPRVDCVKLLKTIYGLTHSSLAFFNLLYGLRLCRNWASFSQSLIPAYFAEDLVRRH